MGEFQRIEALKRLLSRPHADVLVGIGDDAAVWSPRRRYAVFSVDAAVEGTHFLRSYASWEDIGYRALMAAASDIAAMGAHLDMVLMALVLPDDFGDTPLGQLNQGILGASEELGAVVVGGNLARGRELSITTTVIGSSDLPPLLRSSAKPGDGVYVTGTVGDAALGLRLLQQECPILEKHRHFVERWRRPSARLQHALSMRDAISAAIDVSDGLVQDLEHLCRASGVGATLQVDQLPLAAGILETAQHLGLQPVELALHGGEDYELLFTAAALSSPLATRIGTIESGSGVKVVNANGAELLNHSRGFRHW